MSKQSVNCAIGTLITSNTAPDQSSQNEVPRILEVWAAYREAKKRQYDWYLVESRIQQYSRRNDSWGETQIERLKQELPGLIAGYDEAKLQADLLYAQLELSPAGYRKALLQAFFEHFGNARLSYYAEALGWSSNTVLKYGRQLHDEGVLKVAMFSMGNFHAYVLAKPDATDKQIRGAGKSKAGLRVSSLPTNANAGTQE